MSFFNYDETDEEIEIRELTLQMKNYFNEGRLDFSTNCLQRLVSKVFTKTIAMKYYHLDPIKTIKLMKLMNFNEYEINYAKNILGVYPYHIYIDIFQSSLKLESLKYNEDTIFELNKTDSDDVKGLKSKLIKFKNWFHSKAASKCYKEVNDLLLKRSLSKLYNGYLILSQNEAERIWKKYSSGLVKGIIVQLENKKSSGCGGGGKRVNTTITT